ncbi:MAG: 4Fe-4S dicluster domain-containing protein [Syntrophomonadaceae bacterium]|jgi:carbon-monoxide dehydrogenase iron sulfur subunit
MERTIVVDYHKCVGCRTCEIICSLGHEGVCTSSLSRIRVVKDEMNGWNYPLTCAMCEKPVCVNVCPVGAILKSQDTGLVTVNEERCIGCRQCVLTCPFSHMNFNAFKGVAFKCDQCQGNPRCVEFCWTEAISYLPLDMALEQKRQLVAGKMLDE